MLKVAGTVSSWSCWRPTCRQSLCNIPHTVWLWPSLFPLVHSWRWLGPLWRWLSCSARSSHLIRECRLRTSCRCLYKLDLNNIITALPTYHSITNIITALPTLSQHYHCGVHSHRLALSATDVQSVTIVTSVFAFLLRSFDLRLMKVITTVRFGALKKQWKCFSIQCFPISEIAVFFGRPVCPCGKRTCRARWVWSVSFSWRLRAVTRVIQLTSVSSHACLYML